MGEHRRMVCADIERAWGWLEHWGHPTVRRDLPRLTITELADLRYDEQRRVKVLSSHPDRWYW